MAQVLAALAEHLGLVPGTHMVAHKLSATPVPGIPCQACTWCTGIRAGKALIHVNEPFKIYIRKLEGGGSVVHLLPDA